MHLTRCQDQRRQSLDEFYDELAQSNDAVSRDIGQTMCSLISRLRASPDARQVYGLTSHHRLCLLASDTYQARQFVILSALDRSNYWIEYLMPEAVAPWPEAYIRGEAHSEDEAVRMVLTAMINSQGWDTPREQGDG